MLLDTFFSDFNAFVNDETFWASVLVPFTIPSTTVWAAFNQLFANSLVPSFATKPSINVLMSFAFLYILYSLLLFNTLLLRALNALLVPDSFSKLSIVAFALAMFFIDFNAFVNAVTLSASVWSPFTIPSTTSCAAFNHVFANSLVPSFATKLLIWLLMSFAFLYTLYSLLLFNTLLLSELNTLLVPDSFSNISIEALLLTTFFIDFNALANVVAFSASVWSPFCIPSTTFCAAFNHVFANSLVPSFFNKLFIWLLMSFAFLYTLYSSLLFNTLLLSELNTLVDIDSLSKLAIVALLFEIF